MTDRRTTLEQEVARQRAAGRRIELGRAIAALGRLERDAGDPAAGRDRLLAALDDAGSDEPGGAVYEELGECLLALGDDDRARRAFLLAAERLHLAPWFPDSDAERAARIRRLGTCGC